MILTIKNDEVILNPENIGLKNKMKKIRTKTDTRCNSIEENFNAGQIKQSFSHGRSRSVSVEVKKKNFK